jgi:DNA-binding beta-propeller fold protein YncE
MSVILGSGEFQYRVDPAWEQLPEGWTFAEVADVAVDSHDRVYVFDRGPHPVTVFDRDGRFLRSWGEDLFTRPHGLHIGPDDTIYCTDIGDHTVRRCTPEGKVLLQLGTPHKPAPFMSGRPFARPAHTALSPTQEIYVCDGYDNARVHKYDPDGKLLLSWGAPGTDPGQFNVPHNVCCDDDGRVYVADRENHRVQVFDGEGRFLAQWNNLHRPQGLWISRGTSPLCYIAECGSYYGNRNWPNIGVRLTVMTHDGQRVGRAGGERPGTGVGEFIAPHGVAVDSRGDVYMSDVAVQGWPGFFPDKPRPAHLRTLHKLTRIGKQQG